MCHYGSLPNLKGQYSTSLLTMASQGPPPPNVSAGPMMLQAIWSMDGIAAILVALRLIASGYVLRKVSIADYLMVAALLFGISNNICITISEHYGLGRHIMYLKPLQIVNTLKWQTISEPLGIMSPTLGRIAFAVYMLKLVGPDRKKRWTLLFCIVFSAIVNVLCIILIFAQCEHVQSIYDTHVDGRCWSKNVQARYGYFQGVRVLVLHAWILSPTNNRLLTSTNRHATQLSTSS